jgi:phage baseplate assembly protein W
MAVTVYGKPSSNKIKNDIKVVEPKVYGLKYPIGSGRGYFSKQTGDALIRGNLTQILKTEQGERVMLPNYGCNLKKYLFDPLDETTFNSIKVEILTSIARYLPSVDIITLRVVSSNEVNLEGVSAILITLAVRLKDSPDSLIETTINIG